MLNEAQRTALEELSSYFHREEISWICIGGIAAIAWGAKRPLADIDILIGKKDIDKVSGHFEKETIANFRHYITKSWDIRQTKIIINNVTIDVCQAEDFFILNNGKKYRLDSYVNRPSLGEVAGITIPVLPKKELIRYKKLLGRYVDHIDLRQLENET